VDNSVRFSQRAFSFTSNSRVSITGPSRQAAPKRTRRKPNDDSQLEQSRSGKQVSHRSRVLAERFPSSNRG